MSVRYRAACSNCHSAKVRCSGERTGCQRCRNLQEDCVYVESRVGKTRRRRTAQKSSDLSALSTIRVPPVSSSVSESIVSPKATTADLIHDHVMTDTSLEHSAPSSSSSTIAVAAASNPTRLESEAETIPANDFLEFDSIASLFDMQDFGIPDGLCSPTVGEPGDFDAHNCGKSPEFSPTQAISGFSAGQLTTTPARVNPSQTTVHPTFQTSTAASAFNLGFAPKYRDFDLSSRKSAVTKCPESCISALAKILDLLEGKLNGGLCAIDEVLRINKDALTRLNIVLAREDYAKSLSCPLVAVAIAQSVTSLFETAHNHFKECHLLANDASRRTMHSSHIGRVERSSLCGPGIGFGCFSLEPEQQIFLQAQIIRREIQRALTVTERLERSVQAQGKADEQRDLLENWLTAIISSMEEMIRTVAPAQEDY